MGFGRQSECVPFEGFYGGKLEGFRFLQTVPGNKRSPCFEGRVGCMTELGGISCPSICQVTTCSTPRRGLTWFGHILVFVALHLTDIKWPTIFNLLYNILASHFGLKMWTPPSHSYSEFFIFLPGHLSIHNFIHFYQSCSFYRVFFPSFLPPCHPHPPSHSSRLSLFLSTFSLHNAPCF